MERACPGVPETWESEVLPSILELLKSQFAELRSHLTAELCDAVRVAATAQSLPSRRESREAELVTRSQASGVSVTKFQRGKAAVSCDRIEVFSRRSSWRNWEKKSTSENLDLCGVIRPSPSMRTTR